MCGRYAIIDGKKVLLTYELLSKMGKMGAAFDILPRYNAGPMSLLPVVAVRHETLVVEKMQWWFIPHHAKEFKPLVGKDGRPFSAFNAKSETVDKSPLYAPAFKSARCLVPADAFYEWQKFSVTAEVQGKKKTTEEKQPMCIRMKDEKPFLFAGLFSVWENESGEEFLSFTIITTVPNTLLAPIHNRMPVILHEKDFEQWLDRDYRDTEQLKKLLVPYPESKMKAYKVSKLVSNSRNDVPECIKPIE